jgi:hypothetical protein
MTPKFDGDGKKTQPQKKEHQGCGCFSCCRRRKTKKKITSDTRRNITNKELASCILGAGRFGCIVTKKQQQKHEEPVLWSIAAHDLEEVPTGIDRYLQRLGDSGPGWERSCSIGRGEHAVLQPYYPVLQDRRYKARQKPILCYFKRNLKNFQLIQRRQNMIQWAVMIHI